MAVPEPASTPQQPIDTTAEDDLFDTEDDDPDQTLRDIEKEDPDGFNG